MSSLSLFLLSQRRPSTALLLFLLILPPGQEVTSLGPAETRDGARRLDPERAGPSPPWVGWNWNTKTEQPSREPEEPQQDWEWSPSTASYAVESPAENGRSIRLQVLEDDPYSYYGGGRPSWGHGELYGKRGTYDPYAYQYGAYGWPSSHLSHEWKDLNCHHHDHQGWGSSTGASASASAGQEPLHDAAASQTSHSHRKHSGKHYQQPNDYYKRKRYRLEIHPGFIAAPIAGLAAFGAVHAFTSNPVLLELGLVDKKPGSGEKPVHSHHHDHHHHGHGPPIVPVPWPVPVPDGHGHGGHGAHNGGGGGAGGHHIQTEINTNFPIIRPPPDKPAHGGQGEGSESKPWWSPFAAIIPRLRKNERGERD